MSKKKNKKSVWKNKHDMMDLFIYPPGIDNSPQEGDLRFHQRTVEKRFLRWGGWYDYKDLGSTPKTLQRFDGKDWRDIPFEREYIEI